MLKRVFVNVVLESSSSSHNNTTTEDEHEKETVSLNLYSDMAVDNNAHPLFIHNSDHPGLLLLVKKLTGPDNYASWSRSMQIALNVRNKFVLVNGDYPKPDTKSPLCAQWERVNDLVITWILNSMTDDISDGLNYVTTAEEVRNELRERFSGVNGHRVFQVLKDIHNVEQGNKSVEVYFHKLKGLWDEYFVLEPAVDCTCGAHKLLVERDQKHKLLQFLLGLHESNSNIRGQILMMNPLPSISQAYSFVKHDEKTRQRHQNFSQPVSPFANAIATNTDGVAVSNGSFRKSFIPSIKPVIKCSHCNYNGYTK
ncbi:uncharacterized protein LOC141659910 [Apium graveolens]|uniref:uncharacterized protein LOC141659910 n=1 Tax=Apium graveolens TaxID=4045 RepID=UPI003D7A2913